MFIRMIVIGFFASLLMSAYAYVWMKAYFYSILLNKSLDDIVTLYHLKSYDTTTPFFSWLIEKYRPKQYILYGSYDFDKLLIKKYCKDSSLVFVVDWVTTPEVVSLDTLKKNYINNYEDSMVESIFLYRCYAPIWIYDYYFMKLY